MRGSNSIRRLGRAALSNSRCPASSPRRRRSPIIKGQVDRASTPRSRCVDAIRPTAPTTSVCVANGLNTGTYGYNNLQWYGSYYHKFDELCTRIEFWHMHENMCRTQQLREPGPGADQSHPFYYMAMRRPCAVPAISLACTAREWSTVAT